MFLFHYNPLFITLLCCLLACWERILHSSYHLSHIYILLLFFSSYTLLTLSKNLFISVVVQLILPKGRTLYCFCEISADFFQAFKTFLHINSVSLPILFRTSADSISISSIFSPKLLMTMLRAQN